MSGKPDEAAAAAGTPGMYSQQQWASAHIPIDPALQSAPTTTPYTAQHYQAYNAQYQSYYQQYGMMQQPHPGTPQPHQPQQQQYQQPTQPAPTQPKAVANTSASGMDTSDLATMNDALGSAGIDLRAEAESLNRTQDTHTSYRSNEDRSRKQPANPSFDTRVLGTTMRAISAKHKVAKIPDDSINYLALALRTRLQELITQMIAAAHHRTDTQFDRPGSLYPDGTPMWGLLVRSDVAKQLVALERVEREEETKIRRERKERMEMAAAHAAALAAQSPMGGTGAGGAGEYEDPDGSNAKRKRGKKDQGPGVTAKNMSEDVRKKMSNAAASQAAGLGGKYSWMTAGSAAGSSAAAKLKPAAAASSSSTSTAATTPAPAAGGWARAYVASKPTGAATTQEQAPVEKDTRMPVTLRDAMFVVEKERGHGGGRGAAMGWV